MTSSETIEFHELLRETCERGCQSLDDVRAEICQHCGDDANDHDHSNNLPESFLQLTLRHVKQERAQYFLEQLSILRRAGLVQLEEGHPSAVSSHELLELIRPECLIPAHLGFHIRLQGLPDSNARAFLAWISSGLRPVSWLGYLNVPAFPGIDLPVFVDVSSLAMIEALRATELRGAAGAPAKATKFSDALSARSARAPARAMEKAERLAAAMTARDGRSRFSE
eukprot:CAMPEP_0181461784 /NCGR_PEP_ID=MMETSP1110-20121109/34054_1 /TAXON_ID=174948 /ORGANISM="Symbiodinium sp., Strain CCMP421" /LENGTH=224 /DNA_ID=CAMNT_0023586415 /DNA_START=59 /DNA_END=731 /DNA_ORIENTATION=+